MRASARHATSADLGSLLTLYGLLQEEMVALHGMWAVADGLDEPVQEALRALTDDPDSYVIIGEIDGHPFGFLVATIDDLLMQANGEKIGSIRLVFVEKEAREVGVGEAMRDLALATLRERGIRKFDAYVLPGHRLAKNFFEAGGFSARSIVMHHDDLRE
jgi:ribosomal protein S18 acetylase RimI-like enzyme